MDDAQATQPIKSKVLPRISSEAAVFLFIALVGTLLVHLGFAGLSAYYDAMGFPPALFPPDLVLLQIIGFLYGLPALVLLALTPGIGFLGWMIGRTRWFVRNIAKPIKHSSKNDKWSVAILTILIVMLIGTAWGLWNPLVKFAFILLLVFIGCVVIAASATSAKNGVVLWLIPGVVISFFYLYIDAIIIATAIAAYFGGQDAREIKAPQFSTVIPVAGESYTPGKLIVCSEQFCGFHNGLKPRIVSLAGIREIVPPPRQLRNGMQR